MHREVHCVATSDADWFNWYEIPDQYDYLCRECAREVNEYTPESMNDSELIAAIVLESIGYASPSHAVGHVRDFRAGRTDPEEITTGCERLTSRFDRDVELLIEAAHRYWIRQDEETQSHYIDLVESWQEQQEIEDSSTVADMEISMALPVHLGSL